MTAMAKAETRLDYCYHHHPYYYPWLLLLLLLLRLHVYVLTLHNLKERKRGERGGSKHRVTQRTKATCITESSGTIGSSSPLGSLRDIARVTATLKHSFLLYNT